MATDKKAQREKSLEKMTVKDLREVAKEIPEISGVHGMNKAELISAVKAAKGIKDEVVKKKDSTTRQMKKKIQALKAEREAALQTKDKKMAAIYRRKISRLKKQTRKAA